MGLGLAGCHAVRMAEPSITTGGRVEEREGRVLRVVYDPGEESIWVVTAFFDRSMRGKL